MEADNLCEKQSFHVVRYNLHFSLQKQSDNIVCKFMNNNNLKAV